MVSDASAWMVYQAFYLNGLSSILFELTIKPPAVLMDFL